MSGVRAVAPWLRRVAAAACLVLASACALLPVAVAQALPPLPEELAQAQDLRGAYRSALCLRDDMRTEDCATVLHRFAGERPAPRPPPANPAGYRLLFVPGFLASCFPSVETFADVVAAARAQGFDARALAAEGRNGVDANARMLAKQLKHLPADDRSIVLVGHSKGAVDALALIVARPELTRSVVAVLAVGGALQGSPLADRLHGLYRATLGAFPFPDCVPGDGDAVADLSPQLRRDWWAQHGAEVKVPVYSLVSVPDAERLSASLLLPYAGLARDSRYNDGMVLARDQIVTPGRLLGVVNADHLAVAIPFPGGLPWALTMTAVPFPRPQAVLAAIDVIAAETRPAK